MVVALYLGHCGANPNRYEIFHGTEQECQDYIDRLPATPAGAVCDHCGGYTRTSPVKEECYIEDEE